MTRPPVAIREVFFLKQKNTVTETMFSFRDSKSFITFAVHQNNIFMDAKLNNSETLNKISVESSMRIFDNSEFGSVRTVLIDGNPWLAGNDVAKMLGYKYMKDAIRDNVDDDDKMIIQLSDIQDGEQDSLPDHMKGSKITIINESGFYSLVLRSNMENAKKIKRWVTSEVLPSIRKTGSYSIDKKPKKKVFSWDDFADCSMEEYARAKMVVIEGLAKMMNMNDVSRLALIEKNFGQIVTDLPDYVKVEDATLSAKDLLSRSGLSLKSADFNKIMENHGYLERITRTSSSSKNGVKSFWKVTELGHKYGDNLTSPHNPRETQPRWYVDRFGELLKELGLK